MNEPLSTVDAVVLFYAITVIVAHVIFIAFRDDEAPHAISPEATLVFAVIKGVFWPLVILWYAPRVLWYAIRFAGRGLWDLANVLARGIVDLVGHARSRLRPGEKLPKAQVVKGGRP